MPDKSCKNCTRPGHFSPHRMYEWNKHSAIPRRRPDGGSPFCQLCKDFSHWKWNGIVDGEDDE